MTMTSSGPRCDVCNSYILGLGGKRGEAMDIWQIPSVTTAFVCHEGCRGGFKDFKIRLLEALSSEYESWVRWFLAGNTVRRDDLNDAVSKALNKAIKTDPQGGAA